MNESNPILHNRTSNYTHSTFIHYLQFAFLPCMALLGIGGNTICAIVFSTKSLRRVRSSSYLFLLALADLLFSFDLLPIWVSACFVRSLYYGANLVCKIQTYISFIASFLHIWMVIAFTAERFFAVSFPLKHMSKCTTKLSHTIILIIVVPVSLFYIYPSFFASEVDKHGQCREKVSHVHYLNYINTIDTIMTMFLPFIFVSIINVLIIKKLFCSHQFRQHVFENGSSYQCRRTSYWPQQQTQVPSKQDSNRIHSEKSSSFINRKQHSHDSTGRHILTELRLTKMLLAISLTCLLLNFPSYYLRLMMFYEQTKGNLNTNENYTGFMLYRDVILHYLSYLSYTINIFIYMLFGANFRRELKRMFLNKKRFNSNRLKMVPSNNDNDITQFNYIMDRMTGSFNDSSHRCSQSLSRRMN